ncbi:MAG: hypothetical protein WBW04_05155 [Nitrolancea sp.]
MATLLKERPRTRSIASIRPDPSWEKLYVAGGICAFGAMLAYLIALSIEFSVETAPESGGAATLQYIADHRSIYILQQILWLGPSILLMVTFLALWPLLKELDKSIGAIGVVLGIVSWGVTLAYPATGGGAPALVYLSDQNATATTDSQRAAFASAAEGFIAQNYIATMIGVLEAAGILIVSLVLLGGIVHRGVAYLGIAAGAVGIVCEALKPVLGMGYALYGLLLFVWIFAVGWELIRVSRSDVMERDLTT